MTYADIIRDNCEYRSAVNWWPRFAYHMTDVSNAISILSSGFLYSRVQADGRDVMQNDNASRQVIDMTNPTVKSYVRFYFRPLTPTQYHNEGYKHRDIRYHGDEYANMPVPVFLLFDLEAILRMEETRFSELSQARKGSPVKQGLQAFSALPFDRIYSNGPSDRETIQYRQAEILYPSFFEIADSIKFILCRNDSEKQTLLNLLKDENFTAYERYKGRIKIALTDTFQRNGLYVENVIYHGNLLSFTFADTPEKRWYVNRHGDGRDLDDIEADFLFEWINTKRTLFSTVSQAKISYLNTKPVVFKLPVIDHARTLKATLRIDGMCICAFEQPLSDFELV